MGIITRRDAFDIANFIECNLLEESKPYVYDLGLKVHLSLGAISLAI